MKGKATSVIMMTLLAISMLTLAFDIQPAKAVGIIYIRPDGSVDPDTAPISSADNVTYTFTDNIYADLLFVWEIDNIVIDGTGYTLQGTIESGQLLVYRSNNVTIKNMEIRFHGIYLVGSSNCSISGNTVTNKGSGGGIGTVGITIESESNYNSISGNTITGDVHGGYGVRLAYASNYNSVSGNNIANYSVGIGIYGFSSNNSISGNNIANNAQGIWLRSSSNYNSISGNNITGGVYGVLLASSYNKFYHNNFIDNKYQVFVYAPAYAYFWDDGYPSGGNYWSDHITDDRLSGPYQNEPGIDGIVDQPYIIDEDNRDNYPLAAPWTKPPPPTPIEASEELIETITSWNLPKGTTNCLTSKLRDAISNIEIGNLNGAIHKLGDFVKQVENDRKDLTDEQRSELLFTAQKIIDLIQG